MVSFSALPLAITITESLVDVSLSTDIILNVSFTASDTAFCNKLFSITASVVITHSIVAIFG